MKINKNLNIEKPFDHPCMERARNCIEAVINEYSYGAFIISEGGYGKTTGIINILEESNLIENEDYIHVQGNVTETSLYKILCDHRDKIIFFDDIGKAIRTVAGATILKQTTEEKSPGIREIGWNSPTFVLKDYPPSFIFTGRIIMCLNSKLNENDEDIKALLSRTSNCTLDPSNKDILEMMYPIAKDSEDMMEVFEFIEDHTTNNMYLNLRLLSKGVNWKRINPERWEKFLLEDMGFSEDDLLILDIFSSGLKGKLAVQEWEKLTGKKRSIFYRKYKKLKQSHLM